MITAASPCVWSMPAALATWLPKFRGKRSALGSLPLYRLPLEFLAAALLTLTAHLGGFLSGVNLPN